MPMSPEKTDTTLRKRIENDRRLDEKGKARVFQKARRRLKEMEKRNLTLSDILEQEARRNAVSSLAALSTDAALRLLESHLLGSESPEEQALLQAVEALMPSRSEKETRDMLYLLSDLSYFESVRKRAHDLLRPGEDDASQRA